MRTKIAVNRVKKSHASDNGPLRVLDGVTFTVGEGETVAIVGPSGCGKSTLPDILVGFERPDQGSVTVDGAEMTGPRCGRHPDRPAWLRVSLAHCSGERDVRPQRQRARRQALGRRSLCGHGGLEWLRDELSARAFGGNAEATRAGTGARREAGDPLHGRAVRGAGRPAEPAHAPRAAANPGEGAPYGPADHHDVEEAIHLADRVIVFPDRPTTIQATFEVPFPHPRRLSSRAMQELRASILRELGVDNYSN